MAALAFASCSYLKNRANDALDVFTFDGSLGPGLYAELRATDFAAVGLGYHHVEFAGMHGRFTGSGNTEGAALGPVILGACNYDHEFSPVLSETTSEFDDYLEPPSVQFLVGPAMGIKCDSRGDYSVPRRGLHVADVGATATLGFVGFHVGFSPGELLDLVLGLASIDLRGDDVFPVPPRSPGPPDQPAR